MTQDLKVGDRVFIAKSSQGLPLPYGHVTQVVPEKGGCLVRPDGHEGAFGWGFQELCLIPAVGAPYVLDNSRGTVYVTAVEELPTEAFVTYMRETVYGEDFTRFLTVSLADFNMTPLPRTVWERLGDD